MENQKSTSKELHQSFMVDPVHKVSYCRHGKVTNFLLKIHFALTKNSIGWNNDMAETF